MPRPVGHGRPGAHVFPTGWATTAARTMDDTLDSTITIAAAGTTRTWSETERRTLTAPAAPVYTGPAGIRPGDDSGGSQRTAGEDDVDVVRYEITVPADAGGITGGLVVTVDTSPDADLVDRTLTVTEVERGDRRFTRVVHATLND